MYFPRNILEAVKPLPDEDRLAVYDAFINYAFDGTVPDDDANTCAKIAFSFYRQAIEKLNDQREKRRQTPEYRHFRKAVLERDGRRCQVCGQIKKVMHVHHIKRFADYPDLQTDIDNGITVCPECHRRIHHG